MFRTIILLSFFSLTIVPQVTSETFRFLYRDGEKYRIVTRVAEDIYINGEFSHTADILNKVAVEVIATEGPSGHLSCTYQTSERSFDHHLPKTTPFALTKDYDSQFWRNEYGQYQVDPMHFMPMVRDVPRFPEADIKPGESWAAQGEEVHDFRDNYLIDRPYRYPIIVQYTYLGNELRDDEEVALIRINYSIFHRVKDLQSDSEFKPTKIMGQSEQLFVWDMQRGRPFSYEESFNYIFHLKSGDVVEYEGIADGKVITAPEFDREQIVEEIQKEIEEKGVEDATVKVEEKGVTITLENINFPPDSALLLSSEKEKLNIIADILKRFPQRDILLVGHTARIGTEESCQVLSEERARIVGEYLLSLGAKSPTQIIYSGMGSRQPIADNSEEEGRKKNRRVEITILEN